MLLMLKFFVVDAIVGDADDVTTTVSLATGVLVVVLVVTVTPCVAGANEVANVIALIPMMDL